MNVHLKQHYVAHLGFATVLEILQEKDTVLIVFGWKGTHYRLQPVALLK